MAKDPAFLFYPGDWLGGTLGMTFEEKGAYMELLMLQFNRGHMTSHMCGQVVGQLWDNLRSKFAQDHDGLWYNVRLEEEIEKRKAFCNSRKNNISGKNQHPRTAGHMVGHTTSHMENENENKDSSVVSLINTNITNITKEEKGAKIFTGELAELGAKFIGSFNIETVPEEHRQRFIDLCTCILTNFRRVVDMKEPLTASQFYTLITRHKSGPVMEVIEGMHNESTLLKKYVSANLTIQSWLRYRKTNG